MSLMELGSVDTHRSTAPMRGGTQSQVAMDDSVEPSGARVAVSRIPYPLHDYSSANNMREGLSK